MSWAESLRPFREHNFRMHYAASLVSWLGDGLMAVALTFAVLDAGGSATDVGLVLAAKSVGLLVTLAFGGVIGDRLPRRAVMVAADLARVAGQGAVAVSVLTGHIALWQFVAAQLVHGAATALFNPASSGMVPQVVPAELYQQANALRGMSNSTAILAGPALGGILVAAVGSGWALVVDAATFAVSALFLCAIKAPPSTPKPRNGLWRDLSEGWTEFRSRPWLWLLVLYASLSNMLFAAFLVLGPTLAHGEDGGPQSWGLVLSAFGLGSILGGVVALRAHPHRPLFFAVLASGAFALPPLGLAAGVPHPVLLALALVGGVGLAVFNIAWKTTVQHQVPSSALSRVSAYEGIALNACQPIGQATAGPAAALLGVLPLLWLAGAVQVVTIVGMALAPSIRAVTAPAPEEVSPAARSR